jgi:hypothetical protein
MRVDSLLRSVVVCFAAFGPWRDIWSDTILRQAWMDFGSLYFSRAIDKFILLCDRL